MRPPGRSAIEVLEPRRLLAAYAITDLGGLAAMPTAMNASGQVVGYTHTPEGTRHAFLYTDESGLLDLGTLGGWSSEALDVNDAGQIVGQADHSTHPRSGPHAFLYAGGRMADLGTFPGGTWSAAYAINNAGTIVGESNAARSGPARPALFANGGVTDVPANPPGAIGLDGRAEGLSEGGVVVGRVYRGADRAFAVAADGTFTDLAAAVGADSTAVAVNDRGAVVGRRPGGGFVYRNGAATRLDGVFPADVNDLGHVVGYSVGDSPDDRAVIVVGTAMIDLNALIDPAAGWRLSRATAINDAGQIAGEGIVNGEARAFRLTPTGERPVAVTSAPPVVQRPGGSVPLTVTYFGHAGIDPDTIGTDDLLVTAPDGRAVTVTAADADGAGGPAAVQVTYTLAPAAGGWTAADTGQYTFAVRPGRVADARSQPVAAAAGTFAVTIDGSPPTATISAAPQFAPDSPTHSFSPVPTDSSRAGGVYFQVRFDDDTAVDPATLGDGDLVVTAPDGTALDVTYTGLWPGGAATGSPDVVGVGAPLPAPPGDPGGGVTAGYHFRPRTVPFDWDDFGVYTVTVNPGQVRDTAGNAVRAGPAGTLDLTERFAGQSFFIPGGRSSFFGITSEFDDRWVDYRGTDRDGTRFTFRVRGRGNQGTMSMTADGYDLDIASDSRRPARVSLMVHGGGDGRIRLRNVAVGGALTSFAAPAADLSGTFAVAGTGPASAVVLGSLAGSPESPARLATAGGVRALGIRGDVRHARVLAGANLGTDFMTGGAGGAADAFAPAAIGSLALGGPVSGAVFAAGLDPVNGVVGDADDRVLGGPASAIRLIRAARGTDPGTRFIAAGFGRAAVPELIDPAADPRFVTLS